MARMYSRSRGKSGSKKPLVTGSWVRYKPREIELLVVKLARDHPPSQIGLILRDVYGIPDVKRLTKKKITQILKERSLLPKLPEDLLSLIKKAISIRKHLETNPKDNTAKRGLILTESKIKRLTDYYKTTRRLPENWSYSPEKASLFLE